ncbi:MAG: LCP family protein [Candidatus Veblenbacteria bacterium]|nr:LCP family protein [Candidatus Veblenbacteria bacterium]
MILGGLWLSRQPRVQVVVLEWQEHSLWENVKRLVGGDNKTLRGEDEGRVNFLILGQGGAKHDGPFLTDTIMVVSLKPDTKQVAMLSLPRDLVVPIPGFGLRKINSANAYGETLGEGKGSGLTSQVVSSILDLPIHYYARLSFNGFAEVIDELGGVPITIEQGFADPEYPTDTNGFTSVNFEPGWQVLSGERALQYVRSRHGTNGEGSDFARARRQQQVLLALKAKLLSPATFLNPSLSLRLYRTLSNSVDTDLEASEAVRLLELAREVDTSAIISRVLDTSPDGLLHETIGLDGAYLLLPNVTDYSELKITARDIFNVSLVEREAAKLIIENGTISPGLAEVTGQSLVRQGLKVLRWGNATHQDFPRTLLYDYSGGSKPVTRELLEALFHITAVPLEATASDSEADFRLILGADRLGTQQ